MTSGQGRNSPIARAIAAMGCDLAPEALPLTKALFDAEQQRLAVPPSCADAAYGPDPRQRLDLYRPGGSTAAPLLLFVHGGGFVRGDKGGPNNWQNANVGRWAARASFLGAVMTYRLAPAHPWPAGADDVALAVDWLRAHAAAYGGDPARILLVGTSAGAVHVAAYLQRRPDACDVAGAVLLSGLYGAAPLEQSDPLYYGDDAALYPDRFPLAGVAASRVPLLVACAEHDPPRFQSEWLGLLERRAAVTGRLPAALVVAGHNHYSTALHLGTADTRLGDAIRAFAGTLWDDAA